MYILLFGQLGCLNVVRIMIGSNWLQIRTTFVVGFTLRRTECLQLVSTSVIVQLVERCCTTRHEGVMKGGARDAGMQCLFTERPRVLYCKCLPLRRSYERANSCPALLAVGR